MENASKALIIAGAILLAILLISLGIFIFGQAQDTVNNGGIDQAALTSFNNKFLKYEGEQKGSVIRSLISEVKASNADENRPETITVNLDNTAINDSAQISSKMKYKVTMSYGSTGAVNTINIIPDSTSSDSVK